MNPPGEFEVEVQGLGFEVWGLGSGGDREVQGFGVRGLVFGVWGVGFGVWGFGLGGCEEESRSWLCSGVSYSGLRVSGAWIRVGLHSSQLKNNYCA